MKKVVSLMAVAAFVVATSAAFAGSITTTKHNLSTAGPGITASPTNQVCVFCHTPHNAKVAIPLWNRSNPAGAGFSLYSSPTMKNHYGGSVGFTSDSISLFCMSCHDGGALGARVQNKPAGFSGTAVANGTTILADAMTATSKYNLNGDGTLMNDHPVNFNITDTTGLGAIDPATKKIKTASVTNGLQLFKSTRGSQSLECSSCHAVHDNTNVPFLRTTNAGSKLCLACHVK